MNRRATGLLDPIATITMRGLPGSQRTLMMLDGFTLNDPYSGGQRDLLGIAPEDVERIEVIRGPFSSLYGGYAMGGVVNVITKMPEERKISFKPGYGSDISREEGLENLRRVYFSYGDKFFDKLSTYISYGYRATDGYTTDYNVTSKTPPEGITGGSPTTSSTGASRYLIGDKGDREWWDDSLSVKGKYEFTDVTNLSLSFTKTRNEYKYDDVQTYLYDSDGQEVWSYGTVTEKSFLAGEYGREGINSSATLETKISSLQVKLTAGILDWDKSWNTVAGSDATSSGGSGTISDCPLTAYNSDLQFTLPLFERHILTFGGTGRQSEVENTTKALTDWRNKDSTTNLTYQAEGKSKGFSVFVQDEIMILDNLTVYIGVREDWWKPMTDMPMTWERKAIPRASTPVRPLISVQRPPWCIRLLKKPPCGPPSEKRSGHPRFTNSTGPIPDPMEPFMPPIRTWIRKPPHPGTWVWNKNSGKGPRSGSPILTISSRI